MKTRWTTKATRLVLAAAACTGALVTGALEPAHAAPGDPFVPAAGTTVLQSQGQPSTLYEVVQNPDGSIAYSSVGASGFAYNALAYNPVDGYLYAMRDEPNVKRHLLRIGQDNVVTDLGEVAFDFTLGTNSWIAGAFDDAGNYYVTRNTSAGVIDNIYRVDVNTLGYTAIPLTDSIPIVPDWVYKDGYLWGIGHQTNRLYRVTAATGQVDSWSGAAHGVAVDPWGYGAGWLYDNGNLAFQADDTGLVYQLTIPNPDAIPATPALTMFQVVSVVQGQPAWANDGASIPGSPVDLSVSKTGPATFAASGTLTYDLVVTNESAGTASGWTLTDQLPAGTTLASIDEGTATCAEAAGVVTCNGGELAGGAEGEIAITVNVTSPSETITNTAVLLGNDEDPDAANNTSTAVSTLETIAVPMVDPAVGVLTLGGAGIVALGTWTFRRKRAIG